jgi:phage-related protein
LREKKDGGAHKAIMWLGDSLEEISVFPLDVKKELGFGLRQAQAGGVHQNAKPLHGNLAGVMELVSVDLSGTYRAVYTVKLAATVYVLHCFKKKSTKGISTPKADLATILARWKWAKSEALKEQQGNLRDKSGK